MSSTAAVSAVIFDLDGTLTGTANPWRYIHERASPLDTLVVSDGEHDLQQLRECGFHLHVREDDDLLRVLPFLG